MVVSISGVVTVTVTGLPPEGAPWTTTVVKIVLSEVMKFAVAADSCETDVESNEVAEETDEIMKFDIEIVVVNKSPKESLLLTATVGLVEPPAVAEGFLSSSMYP